jgi:hypothetical protein
LKRHRLALLLLLRLAQVVVLLAVLLEALLRCDLPMRPLSFPRARMGRAGRSRWAADLSWMRLTA